MKAGVLGLAIAIAVTAGLWVSLGGGAADASNHYTKYRVTLHNLTEGQPLSPPVAATHQARMRMFQVGRRASPELEAIAEDGNETPMFDLFNNSERVTEAVKVGMPLTPNGSTAGGFSDAVTFDIKANRWDRFSLATMLICTNDGFTGLNRVGLPRNGSAVFATRGYDAGTEDNTELSKDIVDPCSALGPVALPGDPDGNRDAEVDSDPHLRVAQHPNVNGSGDLDPAFHAWQDPVSKVTVVRVDPEAKQFLSRLSGFGEVPPVDTKAAGLAWFWLGDDGLKFLLGARHINGVTQAHIHLGPPDKNGPVVAFLFGPVDGADRANGRLARGTITEADLTGPLAGDFPGFVKALRNGDLYVNVHTKDSPSGEIRGQIGARVGIDRDSDDDEKKRDDD